MTAAEQLRSLADQLESQHPHDKLVNLRLTLDDGERIRTVIRTDQDRK